MPQPFKRRENQKVTMAPGMIMHRPALAMGISLVASHWSKLEHTISLAFTVLLGGQEPSAFEAYHELFELNLRHKMFIAAAKRRKLPTSLNEEAQAIFVEARKISSARNSVVHGNWGICDDRPDSLLLCEQIAMNRRVDSFFEDFHGRVDDYAKGSSGANPWVFDFSVDEYTEYKQQDFQNIIDRINTLDARASRFWTDVASFALADVRARRERPIRR
jgi:hypothetical protein